MEGIDKNTFKRIFYDHWDAFKQTHPQFDNPRYNDTIRKMLDCGDPGKMGFVQYRCCQCGKVRRIAFTCKSCFCLSCAKGYTDRWSDFIGRRLLPGVTYRHIVLTMPEFLRIWFYRDPKLLSPFMQAANACLKDILNTCSDVKLDMGNIIVLQTAGRSGHYNPHLHILMTAGGLDPLEQWQNVSYIPYDMMHRKWQYHLLKMLRENVSDPVVEKDIDRAWKDYPKGLVAFLQPGNVPPGGQGLAQYLAKYVVSPPISVRRIERYDGKSVSYWYRDHKTGQIEHETLPVAHSAKGISQNPLLRTPRQCSIPKDERTPCPNHPC
ncbi:MAG: transposase zinc-binding domain-containing protein [Deltaproteobacteria bacterium]|nr:transposase zinc-binding domain-containing protein [Deltaproteobacteria bacterium]